MDKDLLYQNFLANGGNASYEEFQILQSQFMVESPDEELKKKDQPIENGNPPSTQPMEVATPISQDLELNQEQIQQLPDPTSQSSGITAEQPSTDLPSTDVVSSGTGSSDNVNLTQQPTYTKPSVGAMVYPIGNEEIGQYNERVGERNRTITAQIPSVTTTKPAVIKQQELINTLKQPEFTLTPEAEKNLDEILKISDDEIKESEDFIKKFTYGEYDEKPIVNKQPFDSWGVAPDDQSDDNLLALESRGLIQIDRDAEGAPVFEDNKYRYKIIDKTFYDNDYSNYIDNLQREETKKWEEANVDKARTDLNEGKDRFAKGESTPDITPLQDRLNEYYRKTGELFSQDNIEKINTEEGFAQLLAEGIAKKNVAENPSLDYNQEYEKALKAESPYTDEQLTLAGINLIGELARGVSLTKDMHKTMLESTNRDFTDADDLDGELAFFQKIQQNPDYARQFAKYWYTGGGREAFGASETRLKATFNSQEGRSELMDSFEAYRNANSVANYEANKEIFNQTKEDIKKARASKDVNAVVAGVDKLQAVQEKIKENKDYFESFGTLSDERKSVQKIVQKKQLEQQQNEADYKNALFGTAKGNVSAVLNGVLDAGKDLVLGIPRLLNNVTAQSDAANFYMDVVGKPTQIFNVKTSSMLEKITTYDLAGRQIEERNGFLFEKKNDKLTPVTLTSEERSNLVKKDSRTDFSGKGFFGTVANQIVTMAGAEFMGGKVLSLLSKARYGKSIASATQVFGAESAQVRNLISKQKLLANPSNNGVIGWTVATLENNYQDAVSRGLKGWEVVTSMATQSFITGIASKISPDVKFFRESKTLEEGLIQALRNGNSGLAKSLVNQFVNAIPKAMTRDVAPEILQEYSERFGQTAGEIITTVATGKNSVTNFNLEEFRDIGLETAATVATLGLIGHARGQGKTFEYDGKNFDISRLNRQEQLSLLANIYNPQIFKDFKDNFGVTGNKLNEVENRVKEVKKYIDKIPEKEKYSLDSMFKVGVLLQKIEVERENLRKDDGAFAERINRKIAAYMAEVNAILDNDINTETKTENPATNNTTENAETAQSTPQSETVQEQTQTESNEPEQPPVQQTPPIAPIEPNGNGGAESGVEIITNETDTTETTTQPDTTTVENLQDIPADVTNETPQNEEDIVLPDTDWDALLGNLEIDDNEKVQTANIGTDGNAESGIDSVQQEEQGGQESTQGVSATANVGGSEGDAEVNLRGVKYSDIVIGNKLLDDILDENNLSESDRSKVKEIFKRGISYFNFNAEDELRLANSIINPEDIQEIFETAGLSNILKESSWGFYNQQNLSNVKEAISYYLNNKSELSDNAYNAVLEISNRLNNANNSNEVIYAIKTGNTVVSETNIQQNPTFSDNEQGETLNNPKTIEKDGYKLEIFPDGSEILTSPKGKTIEKLNKNGKTNPNFTKNKQKLIGGKTDNQIKEEDKKRKREALLNYEVSNEEDAVLLYFATGGKITADDISREVLGNPERLIEKGKNKRSLSDYKWAYLGSRARTIDDAVLAIKEDYPNLDSYEIRNQIIDIINSRSNITDIQEELIDLYNRSVDPYYGISEEDAYNMWRAEATPQEIAMVESVQVESGLTEDERQEYYKTQFENTINSLSDEQQDELYRQTETNIGRNERVQPENADVAGSQTEREKQKNTNSPEYQQLLKDRDAQESRVKSAKEKLDRVNKTTNQNFQQDQENLFGERQTDGGMFDERADGNAGKEIIANAKREYDKARAELTRINNAIRDFENGNTSGTGAIDFQTPQTDFTPIPQSTYDKLVKRLLGVFKKFGGKVTTDWNEFKRLAEKSGVNVNDVDFNIIGEKAFKTNHTSNSDYLNLLYGKMMDTNGATRIETILQTGWYKDKDGKWKKALYGDAKLNESINFDADTTLGELLNYPELYKFYPTFKSVRVSFVDLKNGNDAEVEGNLIKIDKKNGKLTNETVLQLLGHEVQHLIQAVEGFDRGSNFDRARRILNRLVMRGGAPAGNDNQVGQAEQIISKQFGTGWKNDLRDGKINEERIIDLIYFNTSGEKEAQFAERIISGEISNDEKLALAVLARDRFGTVKSDINLFTTPNGEIYGAKFPDGTIYLNPEKVNANTPIHEFSHLWQQLMPARFKKGVELLKNTPIGKRTFADLKANAGYANKSDAELWNEALVTVMGNEGERIFDSPRASKFKEWLVDLFKKLGNAFGIRNLSPTDKLSTFVKGALSEVMGTKEIIPESSVEQKEVPIYIKKMTNTDLRTMLDRLGLVMDAVCP